MSCEKADTSAEGGEYAVTFETAGVLRFSYEETAEYCLYDTGRTLELDALLTAVTEARMKRFIIPYCAFTRRTERQIYDRLLEKFSGVNGYSGVWAPYVEPSAAGVVDFLKERGYAGDNAYCAAYIISRADKNVSGNFIAAELIKRGVERQAAFRAVAEAGLDESDACRRALEKKANGMRMEKDENGCVPQKTRAALVRFLLSRGFDTGLAVDAVDEYIDGIRD